MMVAQIMAVASQFLFFFQKEPHFFSDARDIRFSEGVLGHHRVLGRRACCFLAGV